jgi:hypothetical protein
MLPLAYAECHLCCLLLTLVTKYKPCMLSVIMLNVIMLSIIMLNVVMLSVIILSFVSPIYQSGYLRDKCDLPNE